jgi:anti-sigma factor RsiW
MSPHLSEQDLRRYHDRELSPGEILALDDHLGNCGTCRAEIRTRQESQDAPKRITTGLQTETDLETAHLLYQEMADYVDNRSSEIDREIIDSHLEFCRSCRVEMQDLAALKTRLDRFPRARYSPLPGRAAARRWTAWWQLPAIRIPVLAAAVLLVVVTAGILRMHFRQQPEVAHNQPRPRDTPAEVIPNSPPPSVPTPLVDSSAVVADLIDGGHHVTLDSDDKLAGFESASIQRQSDVASVLKSGRVRTPSFLVDLKGHSGKLMGAGAAPYGLLDPLATAVESRTPTFHWRATEGAQSYVLTIYDSDSKKVVASDQLTETSWTASTPLERGRTYSWQVRANKNGAEVLMPSPAAAEAKFRIIDQSSLQEIQLARKNQPGSHLMLGIVYAEAGLLDESEHEFQRLLAANPESPAARNLLREVKSLRR